MSRIRGTQRIQEDTGGHEDDRAPEIYPPEDPNYHPIAANRVMFLDGVDREASETIVEHLEHSDATMRVAHIRVLGGAIARVPSDATAFAHRSRQVTVNIAAV